MNFSILNFSQAIKRYLQALWLILLLSLVGCGNDKEASAISAAIDATKETTNEAVDATADAVDSDAVADEAVEAVAAPLVDVEAENQVDQAAAENVIDEPLTEPSALEPQAVETPVEPQLESTVSVEIPISRVPAAMPVAPVEEATPSPSASELERELIAEREAKLRQAKKRQAEERRYAQRREQSRREQQSAAVSRAPAAAPASRAPTLNSGVSRAPRPAAPPAPVTSAPTPITAAPEVLVAAPAAEPEEAAFDLGLPDDMVVRSYRMVAPPANPIDSTLPAFPWPPERPSSFTTIPRRGTLARDKQLSLSDVQVVLSDGLNAAGYGQQSYYSAPGGFALVTRLEGIDQDGSPLDEALRYRVSDDTQAFSLVNYITELFIAPEGMYRLLVFVISDQSFVTSNEGLSESAALELLDEGAITLPAEEFSQKEFSSSHAITVLIYEYAVTQSGSEPTLNQPGQITPQTHLSKSGISAELDKIITGDTN